MTERISQHALGHTLESPQHQRVSLVVEELRLRQEVRTQYRGKGERDDQRCHERRDVGDSQRREHPAFEPIESEEGKYDECDDQRRVHDRVSHLTRCQEDHLEGILWRLGMTILLESAIDVFDIDDGIIHEVANRDSDPAERHGVERDAEGPKNQNGEQD